MATKNERRGLLSEMSIEELQDWLEEALADEDEGVAAILEREIAGREKAADAGKKAVKDKKEKLWGRDDAEEEDDESTVDSSNAFVFSLGDTPSGTANAGTVNRAVSGLSRSLPGRRAAERAQHQAVGAAALSRIAGALSISSAGKKGKPGKIAQAIRALTKNIPA